MKLAGIICEYNPFHNGHLYHIAQTREVTGCDGVICIMSGPFVQRGAPAVMDTWTRAEMALSGGADVVIELPFDMAVSSAQFFALGGVLTAEALGLDYLSFGAESDIETIKKNAETKCSASFQNELKELIDGGLSYARAVSSAMGSDRISPNDILATEYVYSIIKNKLNIKPVAINRTGAEHDSGKASGEFASASFIREKLLEGSLEEALRYIPAVCAGNVVKWASECHFTALSDFDGIISYVLRRLSNEAVSSLPLGDDGYGLMIKKNAGIYNTAEEIVQASTSSSYTASRARRFIIQALVSGEGLRTEDDCKPFFAHILGFRKEAASKGIIKELNKRASVPVITSVSDYVNSASGRGLEIMSRNIEAQDLYSNVLRGARFARAGREFTEKIIIK